jgi:hypothetical protein
LCPASSESESVRTSKTRPRAGNDGDSALKLDCHKMPRAIALRQGRFPGRLVRAILSLQYRAVRLRP